MVIAVVIAQIAVVARHCLDVGLVEDRADQAVVDGRRGVERMLDHIDLRLSPFDNQDEMVDELCCRADVDQGGQRRKVDDDVV